MVRLCLDLSYKVQNSFHFFMQKISKLKNCQKKVRDTANNVNKVDVSL